MVGYINDGHSYVLDNYKRFGFYAYKVNWFSDGLFITQSDVKNQHLLGAKILAFDNTPTEIAAEKVKGYLPTVNTSSSKLYSRFTYQYAGLLYAANIAKKADTITLKLKMPSGEIITHNFEKEKRSYSEMNYIDFKEYDGQPTPLYRKNSDQPY